MKRTRAKRFGPALLLALPFVVALAPDVVDATRTIPVRASSYGDGPQRVVPTGSSRDAGLADRGTTLVNAN